MPPSLTHLRSQPLGLQFEGPDLTGNTFAEGGAVGCECRDTGVRQVVSAFPSIASFSGIISGHEGTIAVTMESHCDPGITTREYENQGFPDITPPIPSQVGYLLPRVLGLFFFARFLNCQIRLGINTSID